MQQFWNRFSMPEHLKIQNNFICSIKKDRKRTLLWRDQKKSVEDYDEQTKPYNYKSRKTNILMVLCDRNIKDNTVHTFLLHTNTHTEGNEN